VSQAREKVPDIRQRITYAPTTMTGTIFNGIGNKVT